MQNSTLLAGLLIAWFALLSPVMAEDAADVNPLATEVDATFFARYAAMLESGFGDATSRLDAARRHYQAARSLRSDDPRVEYGFAVVLLKNFQQQEGLDHLQAAIDVDPAYLPAWRVQYREFVRDREYDELFRRLLTLADAVGVISQDPPAQTRRQEIAEWIGRGMGFLEGPLGDHDTAEEAVRVSQHLRARLGEQLLSAFEAGRIAVIRQHQLLQSHQFAATEVAETERDEELEESQAAREELDEEREQLEMTREEWDAWVEEQVGDIDAQLRALERHHDQVSEEQGDVSDAAFQVRTEIMQIGVLVQQARQQLTAAQLQAVPGQTFRVTDPFLLEQQLFPLQAEWEQYAAEYNALERERLQLLSSADQLFAERETSIARYQNVTGNAAERLQQIDRWDRRLEQESEQAERTDLANSRQVRNVRHRIQNWSTYDPFDLDAEPMRLLAEFQLSAP